MTSADSPKVERGPVALVKIADDPWSAVTRTLELAEGFKHLSAGAKVLIKPNLVGLPTKVYTPPYGVVSTTVVLEGLIRALKDAGVGSITVGEGGLLNEDAGLATDTTMALLGYPELAQRYDLVLADFNQGPYREMEVNGLKLKFAEAALDHDFVISLPTLKTHNQTRVSLSLKNMKGCLHVRSKAACHDQQGRLSHNVALQGLKLYPDLALIDGRYSLARGPAHTGHAHRSDLLIAARDALDADLTGAAVLGAEPEEVVHLADVAQALGRELAVPPVKGGLTVEEVRLDLPYDWEWSDPYTPAAFAKYNVKGFMLPKYDHTLCTGCSFIYNPLLIMGLAACSAHDPGGVEVLTGKAMAPSGRAKATVLMGNCMIKSRKGDERIKKEVLIKGCPPSLKDLEKGLQEAGIRADLNTYWYFASQMGQHYTEDKGFLPADFQPREL